MNKRTVSSLFTALAVFICRFLSLPANFSPLGSFGFFGQSSLLFIITIVTHDYLRGGFYPGFWLTYLGFAMYVVLGKVSRGKTPRQLLLLPTASLIFFIFSNLGVWWYWRDHTFQSLLSTYILALPFYRNTFLGDLVFGYGYLLYKVTKDKDWNQQKTGIIGLSK
jgi:hypothetical protein